MKQRGSGLEISEKVDRETPHGNLFTHSTQKKYIQSIQVSNVQVLHAEVPHIFRLLMYNLYKLLMYNFLMYTSSSCKSSSCISSSCSSCTICSCTTSSCMQVLKYNIQDYGNCRCTSVEFPIANVQKTYPAQV